MANANISSYSDALKAQTSRCQGYIDSGFASVAIPANVESMDTQKKNMLTESGVVFGVIGIIALVAGLLLDISGIWIAGCAAIMSGVYLYIKGRQQLRADAFNILANSIVAAMDKVAAKVSGEWTSFIKTQNETIRKDIIDSSADADTKLANVNAVAESVAWYEIDAEAVTADIRKACASEKIALIKDSIPQVQQALSESLKLASKAQSDIYARLK